MCEKNELSNCDVCTCVCEEGHQPHSLEVRTLLCDGAREQANETPVGKVSGST